MSCPVESHANVRDELSHLNELPIKIEPSGSRVIFNVHRDIWG